MAEQFFCPKFSGRVREYIRKFKYSKRDPVTFREADPHQPGLTDKDECLFDSVTQGGKKRIDSLSGICGCCNLWVIFQGPPVDPNET